MRLRIYFAWKVRVAYRARCLATAAAISLLLCNNAYSAEASVQGLQKPTARVIAHLTQAALDRWPNAEVDVELTLVPEPLRLSHCTDLQITARGSKTYGRLPISLRCTAPTAWQLFLQAQVEVVVPVVITSRSVPRGAILSIGDLELAPRNLRNLRQHFVTDLTEAAGHLSKRPLTPKAVVYSSTLQRPITISKGQRVAISGGQGPVQIAAQGEALEPGMRGEQIKVRNLQSGRELHAWVLGPGRVASHWRDPDS